MFCWVIDSLHSTVNPFIQSFIKLFPHRTTTGCTGRVLDRTSPGRAHGTRRNIPPPLPLPPQVGLHLGKIGRLPGRTCRALRGLHFWAPRIAGIAKMPKTPNLGKITHFGVISPIFTPFREKGEKCPKWAPGGAPRSGTVKTTRFLGVCEAGGARKAAWG